MAELNRPSITISKASLPLKWNESAYVVPTIDNNHMKALVSKIPGGRSNIGDLNWDSLSQQEQSPIVCVSGRCVYSVGADIHSGIDIEADSFSLGLKDTTSNCQICVTIKGGPARAFPSPSVCDVFVITDNVQLNSGFQTQSQDVPIRLQVNDNSKGCVIVVSEYMYMSKCHAHPQVKSLLPVLEATFIERCVKESMNREILPLLHKQHPLSKGPRPPGKRPHPCNPTAVSCKYKPLTIQSSPYIKKVPSTPPSKDHGPIHDGSDKSTTSPEPTKETSKTTHTPSKPHPQRSGLVPIPVSKPKSNPDPVPSSKAKPNSVPVPSSKRKPILVPSSKPLPKESSPVPAPRSKLMTNCKPNPVPSSKTLPKESSPIPVPRSKPKTNPKPNPVLKAKPRPKESSPVPVPRSKPLTHESSPVPVPISKDTPTKSTAATPTKSPKSKRPTIYKYSKLGSLAMRSGKVNVAGIVRWCKPPTRSRGRDYYTSFTMVDETIDDPLSVVAFNSDEANLPKIVEGSIILLRNVKVTMYKGNVQLNSHTFSSFLVFDHDSTTPVNSTVNASVSQEDVKIAKHLQKWEGVQKQVVPTVTNYASCIQAVENVLPGDEFGIMGIICYISVPVKDKLAALTLCDGTKPPFNSASDEDGLRHCEYIGSYGPYMVTVFIHDPYIVLLLKDFSIGSFVMLSKVKALPEKVKTEDGVVVDIIRFQIDRGPGTSIQLVSEPNGVLDVVKERLSKLYHKSNILYPSVKKFAPSPTISFPRDRPFVTISQVLANKLFPKVFRIYASPISIKPSKVEDLCDLYCRNCFKVYDQPKSSNELYSGKFAKQGDYCTNCVFSAGKGSNNILKYVFGLTVTLADSTGQIQVSAVHKQATSLLPNIELCNLRVNSFARHRALKSIKLLFGYDPFQSSQDNPTNVGVNNIDCGIRCSLDKSGKRVLFSFCDTVLNSEKPHSYTVEPTIVIN